MNRCGTKRLKQIGLDRVCSIRIRAPGFAHIREVLAGVQDRLGSSTNRSYSLWIPRPSVVNLISLSFPGPLSSHIPESSGIALVVADICRAVIRNRILNMPSPLHIVDGNCHRL